MNSDLIVITFADADEALKVLEAMKAMRKESLLNLEQSLVVTCDHVGKIKLHQTRDLTTNGNVGGGDILGLLAGLIFGSSVGVVWGVNVGEARFELTRRGLDDKFVQIIETSVANNASAILFWVRRDGRSDCDEVLSMVSLFKGKVHHTTISPETERYLVQILEERKIPD